MHMKFDQQLADQMVEGLVYLNHKGELLHSNKAAAVWLPACRSAMPAIRRLIAEEMTGHTQLPASADFVLGTELEGSAAPQVWLNKNGPQVYVLMFLPPRMEAASKAQVSKSDIVGNHYVMLMGNQIRAQITALHAAVQSSSLPPELRAITWQLDALLHEVGSLALLIQRDQVFSSDRIDIDTLLQTCLKRLAEGDERAARHELERNDSPHGSVYGDAQWLSYAFEALLFGLVRGMAPRSHLQISARQVGDFVVVTGRDMYASAHRAMRCAELLTPDTSAVQMTPPDPVQISTRMLMAQRILELHSGYLKLTYLPMLEQTEHPLARPIESFSVTLLTGLPQHERSHVSCTQCPFSAQAQAYAEDMAQLLDTAS